MSEFNSLPDNHLVTAFLAGDRSAFGAIYDRYGDRIHSYSLNMLRQPDRAAEVTLATCLDAAETMEELEDPADLRSWLFRLARDRLRSETGAGVADGREEGDPSLREQVLDATDDLGERDRHLMMLHLVEGLEGRDLAKAMGVAESNLEVLVSRMRRQLEGAIGPLLIARLGSVDCDEVDGVLGDWGGVYEPKVRARLNRHIGGCEECRQRRALLLSPSAALPGIMFVAAPARLRDRVLESVVVETPGEPEPELASEEPASEPDTSSLEHEPIPDSMDETSDLAKLAIFLVVTVVVGLIGFSVSGRFEPLETPLAEPDSASAPTPSTTTTTTPSDRETPTTSSVDTSDTVEEPSTPPSIEVLTESIDFGSEGTSGEFEVTNSGGSPGEIALSSSSEALALSAGNAEVAPGETATFQVSLNRGQIEEGEIAESITVSWPGGEAEVSAVGLQEDNPIIHNPQASPSEIQVDGGTECIAIQTTISARVRDTSPVDSVVVRWNDGSNARETEMSDVGSDIFQGVIGPFDSAQTAEARIVAFDELGNAGGAVISVNVLPCP